MSPDGKSAATVSLDGVLRIWNVATAKLVCQGPLLDGRNGEAVAFSRDAARRLLAIASEQSIDVWDVARLRRIRRIAIEQDYRPSCLAFSPDGSTLAAGVASSGAEIRLWNVGDGTFRLLKRLKSRKNAHVSDMAFSADGKVLAAIGWGSPLASFETATGKELDLLSAARLVEGPLAFSPDGTTFATTGDRQALHFWDLATGADRLATPDDHQGDVIALAFLADGKTLVSGSRDRTARTWDLAAGRSTRMLPHGGWVESLSVSADGSLLATGSLDRDWGKVRVWNLRTGEQVFEWAAAKAGQHILRGVTLSLDGSSLIAALGDGSLRRWDVSTGKERPIAQPKLKKRPRDGMLGGMEPVARAVFSRDRRSVAMIGRGWAQVVDMASGAVRFKAMASALSRACEFAPDGQSLAVAREGPGKMYQAGAWRGSSRGTSTIVWLDSRTGHVRREIEVPESLVKCLAFSADGEAIAVGTMADHPTRGTIHIFRLRDKQKTQAIDAPCPWVEALCFTPDGKRIAAGLGDTSIVLWDVRPTE